MGLLDDMQEIILIDRMESREAEQVAALRADVDADEKVIAAMQSLYRAGWCHCIAEMRKLRDGR